MSDVCAVLFCTLLSNRVYGVYVSEGLPKSATVLYSYCLLLASLATRSHCTDNCRFTPGEAAKFYEHFDFRCRELSLCGTTIDPYRVSAVKPPLTFNRKLNSTRQESVR
jgi:hypothetical protein